MYSLGFREAGSTLRTVSLSRDFQALSAMVEPDAACYIVVFVGDVHQGVAGDAHDSKDKAKWVLVSFVPSTCSDFEAKAMADNRAAVKAGLGTDSFVGDMWCDSTSQITLSNYIRTVETGSGALGEVSHPPPPEDARQEADARAQEVRLTATPRARTPSTAPRAPN